MEKFITKPWVKAVLEAFKTQEVDILKTRIDTAIANVDISEQLNNYYTKQEIDGAGYITDVSDKANVDDIPTKTSELTNDSGFLTQHQDISGKADKSTTYTKSEVDSKETELIDLINFKSNTNRILDDNGNNVEQRLQEQMDVINQKQLEVGAVPSDVTPTEGSSHWVTSGGVFKGLSDDELVLANALMKHENKISELEETLDTSMRENEALVISAALNDLNGRCKESQGEETSSFPVNGDLTIENSEKISVLGSSFGTGSFNMAGKNWVAKLSLFSDFQFENLSKDGFNYTQLLRYIRLGQITFDGKYALLCDNENSSMDMNDRLRSIINIAAYLKAYGAIPIIATSYADMPYESALWLDYSEKNNFMMWDAAQYCSPIRDARNNAWDSARHLGTRNSQMVTDAYMPHMQEMEKPRMSMKVFRLREGVSYDNLDNIMFFDNVGRAEKYRELLLGVQAISDNTKVDDVQNAGLMGIDNEYRSLAKMGLSFNTPTLISAVLPLYAENVKRLGLSLKSTNAIKVYCMNRLAPPYPEAGSYARFSVSSTISTPSQGAVYSINGTNYTVNAVVMGENDYYCTIYCSPALGSSISAGTMTKVSGNGDSSIPFAIGEDSTLNESGVVTSDTVGHWEELSLSGGVYRLTTSQIKACIETDTIHFLIVPQTVDTFLSNISVHFAGNMLKPASTRRYYQLEDAYRLDGELITEPTFGTVGTTTSTWVDDYGNNIVSETDYENKYPIGCSSIIKVDDECAINYTVPSTDIGNGGWYALEVWSRYFPPIYTDGSGNQITLNSYDYETLNVRISNAIAPSNTNNYSTLQDIVGTYWKRSIFKFSLFTSEQLTIRISAGVKGIEVCKVSLKKFK